MEESLCCCWDLQKRKKHIEYTVRTTTEWWCWDLWKGCIQDRKHEVQVWYLTLAKIWEKGNRTQTVCCECFEVQNKYWKLQYHKANKSSITGIFEFMKLNKYSEGSACRFIKHSWKQWRSETPNSNKAKLSLRGGWWFCHLNKHVQFRVMLPDCHSCPVPVHIS